MRYIRHINITPLLLAAVLVHAVLLTVGCAAPYFRERPNVVYQGYNDPKLPREDVVFVWWYKSPGWISTIDGKVVNKKRPYVTGNRKLSRNEEQIHYLGAELLPGQHTMEYLVTGYKSIPATIRVDADLSPGHTYVFKTVYEGKPQRPHDYYVSLVDERSGAIVAGRSADVQTWSWSDWEQAIQRLKHNSATERQVIELLSEPFDSLPDNTLVYVACPESNYVSITLEGAASLRSSNCGFLFLAFDKNDRLHTYTYMAVPFHECRRKAFKVRTLRGEYFSACKARLKKQGYAKFRTSSMIPSK